MRSAGSERLTRDHRLRKRSEFLALQGGGRRMAAGEYFLLIGRSAASSDAGQGARIGITVSAKVGKAVVRNRIKRCVRETFRRHPVRHRLAADIVVLARPAAGRAPIADCRAELLTLFDRARLRQ